MSGGFFGADADQGAPEGWVTIARYRSPFEAQIARGVLESAGLEPLLAGETVNGMLQAAFRVSLQVAEGDAEAARALLTAAEERPEPDAG